VVEFAPGMEVSSRPDPATIHVTNESGYLPHYVRVAKTLLAIAEKSKSSRKETAAAVLPYEVAEEAAVSKKIVERCAVSMGLSLIYVKQPGTKKRTFAQARGLNRAILVDEDKIKIYLRKVKVYLKEHKLKRREDEQEDKENREKVREKVRQGQEFIVVKLR
jgi:hypothetical protein